MQVYSSIVFQTIQVGQPFFLKAHPYTHLVTKCIITPSNTLLFLSYPTERHKARPYTCTARHLHTKTLTQPHTCTSLGHMATPAKGQAMRPQGHTPALGHTPVQGQATHPQHTCKGMAGRKQQVSLGVLVCARFLYIIYYIITLFFFYECILEQQNLMSNLPPLKLTLEKVVNQ